MTSTLTIETPKTLKYWVGAQRVSLTSWAEGPSLALIGHHSSD